MSTVFATIAFSKWILGLLFSLVLGHLAVSFFLWILRRALSIPEKPTRGPTVTQVPAWLTGFEERVFFTVLVGFKVAGAPIAMVAWLALKLASNWNHPDWKDEPHARVLAFSALLAGLISMLFALFGGLIWSGELNVGV